ncbi:polysaccharide biosynthesis C-terminal domain-containing protein [Caballeronia sp.]|uniref:polysaccharide biosynthesis C-terminal domain-containing protein n=1 Tax=Caballeronia sp. TaxID=1931223 RepID=UPI003C394101
MKNLTRMLKEPGSLALADQCVLSGTNFLTLLFVSRQVSADQFGRFSLAALGLLFLANAHRAIVTQQLNLLGASEDASGLSTRIATLLRAHAVIIPVSIAILGALCVRFFPDLRLFVGASCYLAFFMLQETLRRYWYTVGRIDRAFANDLITYGGRLAILFSISFFTVVSGSTVFLIMAATSLIAFIAGLPVVDIARTVTMARIREVVAQHATTSGWLVLTVLAMWGATQLYPFLIEPLGPTAIALFVASRNLLNAIGIAVQSAGNYLPTRAAKLLHEQGPAGFRRHLLQTLANATIVSIVFILPMLVFATPILEVMYAGRYNDAAPVLRMLSIGIFFALVGTVLGAYALALQDARSNFLSNLGATAFTFTGGLWLIHAYGLSGAAVGGCLSVAIATVLQGAFVWSGIRRLEEADRGHGTTMSPRTGSDSPIRVQPECSIRTGADA